MATLNMNFLSKSLGLQTTVSIILPSFSFSDAMGDDKQAGYYREGMKFQTLWLLHGFSGDQEDYIKFTNIVRYAQDHQLAVIMPAAYNADYSDDPNGAKYMSFITDELPEMLQTYLPLSTKREDNFIGGLSMGAAGTMKIALAYPEKYSYAFSMSGAMRHVDQPARVIDWFGDDPKAYKGSPDKNGPECLNTVADGFYTAKRNVEEKRELPRFLISVGDKDFALENCREARDYLKELAYDVTYEEVPGYGHEWDFWDLTVKKVINEWLPLKNKPIYQ